jgi:hypothetical protein
VEYWIPAEQLPLFNASIQGIINVDAAYFGAGFKGCVPEKFNLPGKDVAQQFVAMSDTWDRSRMDFVGGISTNRKAVFLNILFWTQFDFTALGIEMARRDAVVQGIREAWDFNHIEIPLPRT